MFCRYCGKEVKDKAVVCSGCGHAIDDADGNLGVAAGQPWAWFTLMGLIVLAVCIPPAGLVFGIMGLTEPAKRVQAAVVTTSATFMTLLAAAALVGSPWF